MDRELELGIYGAVIFISLLACAFFLKASGIAAINFINLADLGSWLSLVFSANLLFPVFLFPLPLALVSLLTHYKPRKDVYLASFGGAVPAVLVALALFGISFEKIILAVFFLVGLLLLIETSLVKKEELKRMVTFRTASQSAKAAMTIMGIGLVIAAGSIAYEHNEANAKAFGEKVLSLAFNQQSGAQDLTRLLADSLIKSQQQTLQAVSSSPQFLALTTKSDPDVQAYVASVGALSDTLDRAEYREKTVAEMRKAQAASAASQPITFEFLRKQSPIIAFIADYYWLINTFGLATLFMFVSNLIITNLAGAYAAMLRKILEAVTTAEKE